MFLTNLFDQVAKLKGDEREDLKVLATGVAAALAARKVSSIMLLISVFPLSPNTDELNALLDRVLGYLKKSLGWDTLI
jgi:hypothetical protein